MQFLSSLFFSFLFIKLTRFADSSPGGHCPIPVNLILDEFNNIGRIGGAPDGSDCQIFERDPFPRYPRDARCPEPWSAAEPVSKQPLGRNHR